MTVSRRAFGFVVVTTLALLAQPAVAAPGKLDPGFGTGGLVSTATAPDAGLDYQDGFAIQPDRRILVAGDSEVTPGDPQWRIARYTANGVLDRSFGSGGTVLTDMGSSGADFEHIWDLAVQPDGRIIAAGRAFTPTGGVDIALARYLPDGQLDASFGVGGKVFTAIGPGTNADDANTVTVDDSGRILVGGFARFSSNTPAGSDFALVRYLANGTLDISFNPDGRQPGIWTLDMTGGRDQFNDLTVDAAGRIVAVGSARMGAGPRPDFAVARFGPDGTLDPTFNPTGPLPGLVTTAVAPADSGDAAISLAIDTAGRIVTGGFADPAGDFMFDVALVRYNPDGTLDTSFGTGGTVVTNVGPGTTDDTLEGLVIQPNGKIVIGGGTAATLVGVDGDFMVARYNPDGTLDTSFGTGGIVVTPTARDGGDDEIYAIGLQQDAKLVAAGECVQPDTGRDVCLARYKVGDGD